MSQLGNITNFTARFSSEETTNLLSDDEFAWNIVKMLQRVIFVAIFIISIYGNSLVLWLLLRKDRPQIVKNYKQLVINLAVCDIALTVLSIPFDIVIEETTPVFPYGAVMCKVLWPVQTVCATAAINTIIALSFHRYKAIVYPMKYHANHPHARYHIILLWIIAFVLLLPYALVLQQNTDKICEEVWPQHSLRQMYTALLFCSQYAIPLVLIGYCHIRAALRLNRYKKIRSTGLESDKLLDHEKIVRMLMLIVTVFAVCQLPNQIMWLILDFSPSQPFDHFYDIMAFAYIFTYASAVANPIIFLSYNPELKSECKDVFLNTLKRTICCFNVKTSVNRKKSVSIRSSREPRLENFPPWFANGDNCEMDDNSCKLNKSEKNKPLTNWEKGSENTKHETMNKTDQDCENAIWQHAQILTPVRNSTESTEQATSNTLSKNLLSLGSESKSDIYYSKVLICPRYKERMAHKVKRGSMSAQITKDTYREKTDNKTLDKRKSGMKKEYDTKTKELSVVISQKETQGNENSLDMIIQVRSS